MKRPVVSAPHWPLWPVLGLLFLSWGMFCWPWLSGQVTIPWDAKAHFYPQLVFLAQSIHAGTGFSWAPYVFSGVPQVADPQSLIFTPYALLALLNPNPGFVAFDAVPLLALLVGAVAVALFFKDRNWHPAAALVAAIAFAMGGSAAWRVQHIGQILSIAWFPVVLLFADRTFAAGKLRYAVAAGAAWGFMLLGRDQVAGLASLVLSAYILTLLLAPARAESGRLARLLPLCVIALSALAVVIVPVLMTGVLAARSNRVHIDLAGAERGSLHPAALLTGFIANLFGTDGVFERFWGQPSPRWGWIDLYIARNMSNVYSGGLVAIALVLAAASGALFARGMRFFGIALIVALLYAVGRYTPFFAAIYTLVPGVDLFRRPADGTFLVGALAAYVAGYGVHRIVSGTLVLSPRLITAGIGATVLVVAAAVGLAAYKGETGYAAPMIGEGVAWLGASLVAIVAMQRLCPPPLAVAVVLGGLLTADLIRNNGPNESTALPPDFYPELVAGKPDPVTAFLQERTKPQPDLNRRDRIEIIGVNFHAPNASLIHRLDNVLGYNPVRDRLYTAAVGAGDHAALPDQRSFPPLFPSYNSALARLLGLKYVVSNEPFEKLDPNAPPRFARRIFSQAATHVYELPDPLPRVMFVPGYRIGDAEAIIRSGQWPVDDFARHVVLDRRPFGAGEAEGRPGTVKVRSYRHTSVELEVYSPDGGFVVLNDPYHPWWHAYVDGYTTPIFRANVLFRAVQVPAGRHQVTFVFRPLRGLGQSLSAAISGRPE